MLPAHRDSLTPKLKRHCQFLLFHCPILFLFQCVFIIIWNCLLSVFTYPLSVSPVRAEHSRAVLFLHGCILNNQEKTFHREAICLKLCLENLLITQLCPAPRDPMDCIPPWNSPGKNTGLGCLFLLQGIFLTQGLNLCLLHWQVDSLPTHHLGSPGDICLYSYIRMYICMHTHMTWDILASKNS